MEIVDLFAIPFAGGDDWCYPVSVLFGDQDELTEDQAVAWQRETVRRVELFRFSGGHFFLFNHAAELLKFLSAYWAAFKNRLELDPPHKQFRQEAWGGTTFANVWALSFV